MHSLKIIQLVAVRPGPSMGLSLQCRVYWRHRAALERGAGARSEVAFTDVVNHCLLLSHNAIYLPPHYKPRRPHSYVTVFSFLTTVWQAEE